MPKPSPILPLFCLLFLGIPFASADTTGKPNIVLFFVDDFGQRDLSCYGSTLYETPHLDQLAAEGMRFTDAYSAYPRCVPSRQGLLSGKYPCRVVSESIQSGEHKHHLPLSEVTFGEALKEHGYQTCYIGKWHLGKEGGDPGAQGFDTVIHAGSAGATGDYYYPFPSEKKLSVINPVGGKEGDYLTDRLTDKAVEYIAASQEAPFLLVMAHYAVHTPIQAPEEVTKKYKHKLRKLGVEAGGNRNDADFVADRQGVTKTIQNNPTYAAMVEKTDDSLGRILQALKDAGVAENTVIIMTSDHGGLSTRGLSSQRSLATSNAPLRQGKGAIFEGGTRVPLIVKWPGKTPAGSTSSVQVTGTDHYPTMLEIADAPLRPKQHVDGRSYRKALGGQPYQRDPMFWYKWQARPDSTGDTRALSLIDGNYKIVRWIDEDLVELFDLSNDIGEQNNLAPQMLERTKSMLATLLKMEEDIGNLRQRGEKDLKRRLQGSTKVQPQAERSRSQRLLDSMMDQDDHSVLIAAHRGGYTNDVADDAPENSVANVAVAISRGYEVFETDIQRTDDGVFVMVHDPTLERETNGTGTVESKTLKELQQLRKRFRDGKLSNYKVATLTELLDAGNGQILFKPDLKPGMIDHFDQLARQIAKHPAAKQVFLRTVMSNADAIAKCFASGTPRVHVMFKAKKASQVQKIHKLFSPVTIQIDIREGEPISESRLEAIRAARELGILVETHAYDSPEQTVTLLDAGVRMLHTKKPDTIRKLLDSRSSKSKAAAHAVSNPPVKKTIDTEWQAIDLLREEIVVTGVPTQHRTQDGILFRRFSEDLLSMEKGVLAFNPEKARSTTGVVLHIMTDSPEIQLQFELQEGAGRGTEFAVFQNGQLHQEESFSNREKDISLLIQSETPGKATRYSVTLPSWANPKLTSLQIRPGCKMQTPKVPERVYVALGDSISHGTGQGSATHKTWPFLLSRKLDVSLCNLAVGGGKVSLPAAQSLSQFERVDLVTILVGYNDWNSGVSPTEFEETYRRSLVTIRKSHPTATIVCVTPTYTKRTSPKRSDHTLDEFRQAIRTAAKANSNDQNPIHVIEGPDLTSEANLRPNSSDDVHFGEAGARLFAEEMAGRLTEHRSSERE